VTTHSYTLDTNAFLTAWNETYRPTSFPGFWSNLADLIAEGRAVTSSEVVRELDSKDDDVCKWVKSRPKESVIELEEQQVKIARGLAKQFPSLAKERLGRKRADGFVIAIAAWRGLTVVTAENRRGAEKIPNICDAVDVACISVADMIEAEGWTF
jgi:hypothetical protein